MKVFLIILLVLVGSFLIVNQIVINTYNGSTFSNSLFESKENKYFISSLIPNKDSIQLFNRKIKSPDIWIESAHETSHVLLFWNSKSIKSDEYNIIIENLNPCDSNEFLFDLSSDYRVLNCINELGWIYTTRSNPSFVKLLIKQGSSDVGWEKEVVVDSLSYSK